jgi:hypothetical protein
MDRSSPLLIAALLLPAAAQAQGTISLPLSSHGSLIPPALETAGLIPKTRETVRTAIAAATQASRAAVAAERVIREAMKAGAKAAKIDGYDTLDVPGADGAACLYQGRVAQGRATGLGVMHCRRQIFAGRFRDGRLNGLGGDAALNNADAYEGEYRDGARSGYGIERDKDGSYPGQYGFRAGIGKQKIAMEILGLQDFKDAHWAGRYGFYNGPKIACTLIKGAVLEGSVLDGYGAKFDSRGNLIEQGLYKLGMPVNGPGPPC